MSQSIVGFNLGQYKNYKDAKESKAVYETPSDIDAMGSRNGLMDVSDMLSFFKKLVNDNDLVFGVEFKGIFINFDDIENAVNDDSNIDPDTAIEQLYKDSMDNMFEKAARDILGQEAYDKIIIQKGMTEVALIHSVGRAMINDRSIATSMPEQVDIVKERLSRIHDSGYTL